METSYIYRAAESVSVEQAKRIALERAQLEVIANTFGTKIAQHNSTRVSNRNGESNVDFLNISSSDIQGEWIETIGEPQFDISYEQGMLIVQCHVRGVIREITTSPIDISAKVLRNGQADRFESSEFKSGDDLYLSFSTPVDGYLAVYLIDDENNAFCLLPYRNQSDGIYKVKANKKYVFFSESAVPLDERSVIDEYVMTCERSYETNQVYVIFSPNQFVKANDKDNGETLPRELDTKSFQRWLAKIRKKDVNLTLQFKQISISK
ncbi:MAG: DUF4384 domain-containing protein [Prevotella sp.]|nr:DUF4384 domain-containing protein [Prevotella sp.]